MNLAQIFPDYDEPELRRELHRQTQINATLTEELVLAESICELAEAFCFCPNVGVVEEKARIALERKLMFWRKWKDDKEK